MDDAGSLAVFLAELPASDHPLRRRAHAWSLQLARLVCAMDATLGGAEPVPGPERTPRTDPPDVLEDAVALLTLAGRLAGRVPPVEAALRSGDRELFVWASLAEGIRHDLHGDGIGGTEEEPAPDSTLGQGPLHEGLAPGDLGPDVRQRAGGPGGGRVGRGGGVERRSP